MAETKPWPRAQRMPFVMAGERAQPHHYQAVAEYDEARGEATPRCSGHSVFTAAQVNQAIKWWNKRAALEAAIVTPEPMTDERLAEIRAEIEDDSYGHSYDGGRAARELLAELERVRKEPRSACFLCTTPLGISICTDCAEMCADEGKRMAAREGQKAADSVVVRLSPGVVTVPHDTPVSDDTLRELNQ